MPSAPIPLAHSRGEPPDRRWPPRAFARRRGGRRRGWTARSARRGPRALADAGAGAADTHGRDPRRRARRQHGRRPRPSPAADSRADRHTGRPDRGRRRSCRSRTSGPPRPRPTQASSRRSSPGRAPATRRSSWSRARPTRSSPRSGSRDRPTRRGWSWRPTRPPWPPTSPGTASDSPSCAPTRSGRRSARWPGGTSPCSGSTGSRTLAAWPLTARLPAAPGRRGLRPGDDLDPVRRRRHHARPGRVRDAPGQGQGRRLPVRRRDGRHHRALQGLLAARLGHAVHEADRQRRRLPLADQGRRHRDRQLREPGARTLRSGTPRARSSRPSRSSSTGWRGPASTTSRSPTTTSATPGAKGLLQTITNVTKRGIAVSGRRQEPRRGPQAGGPRGRRRRRSRSSATTRSPAATTRRRPRSAAPR